MDQGLDELAATFAALHFVLTPARQPTQLMSETRFGQVQDVTRPSTQGEIRTRTPLRGSGRIVPCHKRMLYPSDDSLRDHPEPPPGKRWVANQIGLMGLWANFLTGDSDPRLAHELHLPDGRRYTAYAYHLQAREMLAWSRWQLGWLQPGQVRCLTGLETEKTVTLRPVASPGVGTAMVAIPLSETEIVVIESRRRLGYDAGHEYRYDDGASTTLPTLAGSGVLVYVINAARSGGQMPVRVIGPSDDPYPILHFKDYPLLTDGESVSVGGYTITVRSSDDDTDVLTITRDGQHI